MTILIVMAFAWLMCLEIPNLRAQNLSGAFVQETDSQIDTTLTVSLITCYPGTEIYELCGHSAIRVRGEGIDSVWNYGIFDFNQPNFVYRFVKGETDYRGASYPFKWFMPEYVQTGRKVVEQDLNFTPEEAQRILKNLRTSVLPENAVYRYNYVKDNCSLRILNQMDSASTVEIIYPDSVRYGTFRDEMRSYHKNYPWYQMGIDLALGSGLDYPINSREEMFVPVEMMRNAASARFADGRPLVKDTRVLNQGQDNVIASPTPWWLSPLFWAWIVTLIIGFVIARNIINNRVFLPVYGVWFFILGLVGTLSAFLVFVSVHEATSPNVLILWLNPAQFLFVISMGVKRLKVLAMSMAYYNIFVVGILLLSTPLIPQSFNPAFFPLMLSTIGLAAAYAIINNKKSYKIR